MSVKIQGSSGTVADVDVSGSLKVTGTFTPSGTQNVNIVSGVELEFKNDTGNPLPISAASLPLPAGASTEATLSALNTKIPTNPSQEHATAGSPSSARLSDGITFYKATTPSDTQPVSVASLPLPSGAATSAKQDTLQTAIDAINTKTPTPVSGRQPVDGSGVTQPVSVSSLPLPTGASTEVTLAAIKAKTDNLDVLLSTRTKPVDIQNITGTITSRGSDFQTLTGVYYYAAGAFVVNAAADASTVGRCWLINPIGSGLTVRIKVIQFSSNMGTALAAPTSPRITVERVTFTGTASGAIIAPAKRKTTDATNIGSLRTASTGLTLTAGNMVCSFLPIASATAVGYTSSSVERFEPDVEDRIELEPGEGIVIRQPDAGTTADTRRFTIDIITQEF